MTMSESTSSGLVNIGMARNMLRELADAQRVARLGSWEWDVVADCVTWSHELYRIFGLEPDEVPPTFEAYLSCLYPDDRSMVNERVAAALESGDGFDVEHRIIRGQGEVVWIHGRGEVVRDETGAAVKMRGTAQDITVAKRAEEKLQAATGRYRLLQKMASSANQASSVAEVLQAALDEICAHTGWPVGHVYLPGGHDDTVLVSSGMWHLDQPERFEALQAVTAETSFRAGQGLVGRLIDDPTPLWVSDMTLDPTAVRAGAAPGIGVRAHLAFPVRLDGETVAVVEFFSPEAMEPDEALLDALAQIATELARVAERQRSNTERAAARLRALAVVEAGAHRLSGETDNDVHGRADLVLRRCQTLRGAVAPAAALVRVLLIDDEPALRLVLRYWLSASGRFEVVGEAGDGRQGIEQATCQQPDLIVLDMTMPVMDGLEAIPHLARCSPRSLLVMLSASHTDTAPADAMAAGAHGYIEKGHHPDELLRRIIDVWESAASILTAVPSIETSRALIA